jgi:hypothetical protein
MSKKKSKVVGIVGGGSGSTTVSSLTKDQTAAKSLQPSFKTEEQMNNFLRDTKHIPLNKVPKMPFKMLGDYVEAYLDILEKNPTDLTGTQRIHVKNIVHYNLRKGTIKLT